MRLAATRSSSTSGATSITFSGIILSRNGWLNGRLGARSRFCRFFRGATDPVEPRHELNTCFNAAVKPVRQSGRSRPGKPSEGRQPVRYLLGHLPAGMEGWSLVKIQQAALGARELGFGRKVIMVR